MPIASNGPAVINGFANNFDRAICFDAPVALDTGLYVFPERTLITLCNDMMIRLGFAAMVASPPPGMITLLKSFLQDAQEQLYVRYDVLRTERWWAWQLSAGKRFYDTPLDCTKALNFRKITFAAIADNGGRALQAWDDLAVVALGVFFMPTTKNGFEYEVTTAGTTGATEPTWPVTAGATVVSGSATFTARVSANETWTPITQGINPLGFGSPSPGFPTNFELREYIEVWPAPKSTVVLWLRGHLGLKRFTEDTDVPTIDHHPLFLFALANAKAHYGHPDANNYAQMASRMLTEYVAASHGLHRYHPTPSRLGLKDYPGTYDDCAYPLPRATWR